MFVFSVAPIECYVLIDMHPVIDPLPLNYALCLLAWSRLHRRGDCVSRDGEASGIPGARKQDAVGDDSQTGESSVVHVADFMIFAYYCTSRPNIGPKALIADVAQNEDKLNESTISVRSSESLRS